jgi:hypothetical protein
LWRYCSIKQTKVTQKINQVSTAIIQTKVTQEINQVSTAIKQTKVTQEINQVSAAIYYHYSNEDKIEESSTKGLGAYLFILVHPTCIMVVTKLDI